MKEKNEISRTVFNQRVKQFITYYNCRSFQEFCDKHLPNGKCENSEFIYNVEISKTKNSVANKFFSDSVIQDYLSRKSVNFIDRHPQLESETTNLGLESDDYELALYRHMSHLIMFRNADISTEKFYTKPNLCDKVNQGLFKKLFKVKPQFEMAAPMDILHVAQDATTRAIPGTETKTSGLFLLNPVWQGGHATTCLSILDPETNLVLLTIYIDSQPKKSYSERIINNFRENQYQSLDSEDPELNKYMLQTFSIDLKQDFSTTKNVIKTAPSARSALLINCDEPFKNENLSKIESCETLYVIDQEYGTLSFRHSPNAPFIEVPHHLQTANDDENCSLYSYNICNALMAYLDDQNRRKAVLNLAKRISELSASKQDATTEIQALQKLFGDDLKPFLPCYYNKDNSTKPIEELTKFHLQQRWDLGGACFKLRFPNKESASLTYPKSYSSLWQKVPEKQIANPLLAKARTILDDYAKNGSYFKLYLYGHFKRHYVWEIAHLVRSIDRQTITDMNRLIERLNEVIKDKQPGSLARRTLFIEKMQQEAESVRPH